MDQVELGDVGVQNERGKFKSGGGSRMMAQEFCDTDPTWSLEMSNSYGDWGLGDTD